MGYILCEKCMGYIKLKSGDLPQKYKKCKCGGSLRYLEKKTDFLKKGDYLEKLPQELGIKTGPHSKMKQTLFLIIYIALALALAIIIIFTVFNNTDPQLDEMIKESGSSKQPSPANIMINTLTINFIFKDYSNYNPHLLSPCYSQDRFKFYPGNQRL
ncbi:MAG: hypothetical protein QME14_03635 [Methanobacteriaceae archaeon]|nr:hypothetical protein [Methanobacteriaceae archaeon]